MAARHSAGQYEDAFSPRRLQIWGVTRPGPQRPSLRQGSTQILADDRGHLLPTVPHSQASPWGTFVGTWDMPRRIPPARLDLTSRSAAAAAQLLDQIHQPTTLTRACNGLWTEVTGKPQKPWPDTRTAREPSQRSSQAPSKGTQLTGTQLEEPPDTRAGATAPLTLQPGCTGDQLQTEVSQEPLAACRPCSSTGDKPHAPTSLQ